MHVLSLKKAGIFVLCVILTTISLSGCGTDREVIKAVDAALTAAVTEPADDKEETAAHDTPEGEVMGPMPQTASAESAEPGAAENVEEDARVRENDDRAKDVDRKE